MSECAHEAARYGGPDARVPPASNSRDPRPPSTQRRSRPARFLALALVVAASFSIPWSRPARAAEPDCRPPDPQTVVFGCVWTGSYYTGTMTLYEASRQ
jgi:hypothetical protein